MSSWLNIFKHLLPHGRAWKLTPDKTLRRFFEGLEGAPEDARAFLDGVYEERFPYTTDSLAEWEDQFGIPKTGLTEAQRRDRLDGAWKAQGGQSPRCIQDTLQAAGFNVFVHEWWEPVPGRPGGGSIDGDVSPTARDPFDYLDDGTVTFPFLMYDGAADAQDGDTVAQDGSRATPAGYPLVNKLLESSDELIGDGSASMVDGGPSAQDGSILTIYAQKQYLIPNDPTKYPYFLYIGGETFPDQADVPESRRDEFEDLCLKICPTEQWLGILVSYS